MLVFFFQFLKLYVYRYFACVYIYVSYVCLVLTEARQEYWTSRPGITDICELPREFWEFNLSPLKEQLVLLAAEPSLQSHKVCF